MKIVAALSFLLLLVATSVQSFAPQHQQCRSSSSSILQLNALSVGTFVEFEEKKHRVHIGKIAEVETKSNGGVRYSVQDSEGHQFNIPHKNVHFHINPPNSPGPANQLYKEFIDAQQASDESLQSQLDISPDILELAWEEALEYEELTGTHNGINPEQLIELIHSHTASAIENYQAWRLLQSDLAHVFFKDMKDHGQVTSFKVKARKAVETAKQAFCNSHTESDLCLV